MFGITKEDSFIKKSLKVVILGAIFLTPILFSTKHIYFFTTPKYVFMAFAGSVCFSLLMLHILEKKFLIDKKIKIFLSLSIAIVIWFFLSAIFGADTNASLWSTFGRHTGFLTYFFALIFLVSSVFIFDKKTIFAPLKAFVFGGTLGVVSVYLSPTLFSVDVSFLDNFANGGTFGNTTYAGLFLVFSLFSSLILFYKDISKNKKWVWFICFLLILFSPIFLNTKNIFTGNITSVFSFAGEARVGLVSVFIGLFSSMILYMYFSKKKIYAILTKIILILLFIASVFIVTNFLNEESKLHQRFSQQEEGVRFVYLEMAMRGIGERPIFGFGLENFSRAHNAYFDPILLSPEYPNESWADKPHSSLLEVAFSTGIPGLIVYLSLFGYVLISIIRKASTSDLADRRTASLFFGLLISYGIQVFLAFDTVSSIQALFVLLSVVSIFCFKEVEYTDKRKLGVLFKTITSILIVLISIYMIYFFSLRVSRESKMIRGLNTISIQKRVDLFKETMDKSKVGMLATESQYIDILVENYKRNWGTFEPEVRIEIIRELEFLLQYSMEKSDKYPLDLRFALIVAKIANGLFDISHSQNLELLEISKKYGLRSIHNSPFNEKGYRVMAETYLLEGKFDTAIKFAEMRVNLNPRVPEFHNFVIFIAKVTKNQKLINDKIKEAQKFIPSYEYLQAQ